jgi:hypothetical protein
MMMLRLGGAVVLLLSVGVQAGHAAGRTVSIRGTIIAYRPAERATQVVSHVLNRESFLFRVDGSKPVAVKLVYEHFGYTALDSKTLAATPVLEVRGHRDASCDELLAAFVQSSPKLRNEASPSDATEPLVFLGTKPSSSQPLKCYRVAEGGLRVEKSAAKRIE